MVQLTVGALLVVAGAFAGSPAILLLGLVLALAASVNVVWARRGLDGVSYRRTIPHPRAVVGDEIPLDITVWNRKSLPLAWLRAEDDAGPGVRIRGRDVLASETRPGVLVNAWTLAPFERVTRHFRVLAERRGVFTLGPARLEIGDLLARRAAALDEAEVATWLVRPRTVSVAWREREEPWGGELRARHGLVDDPTRYAGVRPYQPGDPIRRVHWPLTSRLGAPVSKQFDPARHREVAVLLDLHTASGPDRLPAFDDDLVEGLCVAAASLVRRLLADGAAVGLAAAAYSGATRPLAYIAPGASDAQLGRCLDLLARMSSYPSAPFGRLVASLVRTAAPGTSLVVLTGRDPSPYLAALRRASASGFPVRLLALGPGSIAATAVAGARRVGISSSVARLDGPWRTARTLVLDG